MHPLPNGDVINDAIRAWHIICTTTHPHLYTFEIVFVWRHCSITRSSGQTSRQTKSHGHAHEHAGWNHFHIFIKWSHHSCTVVSCVKHYSDLMAMNYIKQNGVSIEFNFTMLKIISEIVFWVILWQTWNAIRIGLFEFKGEMLAFECHCHGNLTHHAGD